MGQLQKKAGQADTQDEKGEDSGRRRDVGEGDREAGVNPQHPPQLLLIAEPRKVSDVGTVRMVLQVVTPPSARAAPKRLLQKVGRTYHLIAFASTPALFCERPSPRPSPAGAGEGDTASAPLSPTLSPGG